MKISRRNLVKLGVAAGTTIAMPSLLRAQTAPSAGRTARMVMDSLRIFDPVYSTTATTQSHAMMIYDTLFAPDSKLVTRPQMVGKWGVSDDKKTYTFELRDGLTWHDGTAVTAADCVASIRRWAQVDTGGQLIMARAKDISKKDERTFTIALNAPLNLLIDLLGGCLSSLYLSVMREKDANRPATEQVTENIGSGPFRFNNALAKPGANFTYDRNENYLARSEAPDGFAGGKTVKLDRVVWDNIPDPQTAFGALQAGEVDFLYSPPANLLPTLESDPNLELQVLNTSGTNYVLRMNWLQKPFDNVKARQAMLHLVDQEAFLRVINPAPKYNRPVTSLFGNDTLYTNAENTGWFKKGGDLEKARQLFKEAGYAGEKVVILDPTNWPAVDNAAQLLAATLRKVGVNAELAPGEWGGLAARRANKGPVDNGGWSIFITYWANYGFSDPIGGSILAANGEKGWYGWPKNDEYEVLRAKWADVETTEERKALARSMQREYWDFAGMALLGQVFVPSARRKNLTNLIAMPTSSMAMWNMQKV